MIGLVLSGGGARGAYQAGVLSAVAEIATANHVKNPFKIYTGVSAGSINACFLAAHADEFARGVEKLRDLWSGITADQVFSTDFLTLGKMGLKWIGDLSLGKFSGLESHKALLDTTPLNDLLKNNLDFSRIQKMIESGDLYAAAITALEYKTSTAITFVEANKKAKMWKRSRRYSEVTQLASEHVMASSAIPLLFPPAFASNRYFGDGCVRNLVPCSAAIHLGAEKIFVVSVRTQNSTAEEQKALEDPNPPSLARVLNIVLNAVLLDGVEVDMERMKRINDFVDKVPSSLHEELNFKKVNYLWVSPKEDLGLLAASMASHLPRIVRYILKGLGPVEDASEIVSYLLFDPSYCQKLIDFGYQDAMEKKDEIKHFLTT